MRRSHSSPSLQRFELNESGDTDSRIGTSPGRPPVHDKAYIDHGTQTDQRFITWCNKLLFKIGRKAMNYRWMHDQESQRMESNDAAFKKAEIVVLALQGILSGSELVTLFTNTGLDKNSIANTVMNIIQFILIFVYCILKGLREANDYVRNANVHTTAAARYGAMNLEIQKNSLPFEKKVKEEHQNFLNYIIKTYNDLMLTVPKISRKTQDKYEKASDENDVYNPLVISIVPNDDTSSYDENITSKDDKVDAPDKIDKKYNYQIERWFERF